MANEINDLKRISLLVLIAIPAIASVNINCNGKAFHCVNSTHFMICVDLGGGLSTTIDDFVIPCPATTVCHGNNIFECEFPKIEETLPPLHVIGVEKQSDISETTLVTNSVTEPTPTRRDTVSVFNDTVLTTATPEEELVLNAFLVENNNETTGANTDNTTVINFQVNSNLIDSAKEINDRQSNNSNVTTISAIDKNKSYNDVKNISVSDKSKSADTNTSAVECILSKPTTDLSLRTTPSTDEFTSSDTFSYNNNSTADKLNKPSQIVPSDISIFTSEVNASLRYPPRDNIATNIEQNITTQLTSTNNKIDNVFENIPASTAISSEGPVVRIEARPAFTVDIIRTTNNKIGNQNVMNEYSTTDSPLLVTNTVYNEVNFNVTESQYVTSTSSQINVSTSPSKLSENTPLIDMPKPLLETDIVNLNLDKHDFILESVILPPIIENNTNSIDNHSNILRTSELTNSVPSNSHSSLKNNSELLIDPNELSALNNEKVDIINKEKTNTDNTIVQVFVDEAVNTIAAYSTNNDNNNKTILFVTPENNDLNDRESKNLTENFTLTNSDSTLKNDAVNGVAPSIQITETNKTFIPLVDQFNNNGSQTVMRTSSLGISNTLLDKNLLDTAIANLTLDKNDFVPESVGASIMENVTNSTVNNFNTLRAGELAVFETVPGITPLTNDLNSFKVLANEAIKTTTTDTSNNNKTVQKFSTENKNVNYRKSKNSTENNTADVVIPSIQITEIANTFVPEVQSNTNTIQNVPNATPHIVLTPKDNSIFATPSSLTNELENTIRNVPNATPHIVLASKDNSNIATPSSPTDKLEVIQNYVVNDTNVESSNNKNNQIFEDTNKDERHNINNQIPKTISIDLVSEPASVDTNNQIASDHMAGPLRIDQLNATFIPNIEITTMPIDFTSKTDEIRKQNNDKVNVIMQPITTKAGFSNDVITIAAVDTPRNMSNKIIEQNYTHVNQTDIPYILESKPVDSSGHISTEKSFVLLPVQIDPTIKQHVSNVIPQTDVLSAEGISNFNILGNPNVQTESVTSKKSLLTTESVSIVPIEIKSVKVEPNFTEPNIFTNNVMKNVAEHVISHNNDIILGSVTVNSNTPPNTDSGIITDIVEVKPFINQDVLSITLLNGTAKNASTNTFPATADKIITHKSIHDTDKNITEKKIVSIGIATSEVDKTPIKINDNTGQNSISESKSTDVKHLLPEHRMDHLTSIQISPTDNILTAIGIPSTDSSTIDQITKLGTPYTEKAINIPKKSSLVTENIGIKASTEPSADVAIVMTNDNVVPTTDQVPLLLAADSNLIDNDKNKSAAPIPIHLVPENITEQLTSTQLSPADILTTVGVSNTVDQITKPGTPYTKKVINIPKKSILVSENIAITASTEPFADVAIAMTNDEIIPTIDQVPKQSSVDNVIANNDKSSVPIPIHLVAENITEYLNSTQLSPADILTAVGVSSADSSTIDQIIKLETQYNEEVINIPEKSRLAIENIDITASTEPSADVTIAMSNDNVVPPTDRVPSLLTMHSNIIDKDKDKSLVPIPIHLVPENRNEYLTSTQTSPTNALASVGVSHTQPGQNQIINLETSYNENVNSIPEKSTLATEIVGITASPQPSADVAIAITNDNVVPTTDQVPLLLAVDSILIDNDKNKSAAPIPIHLVPENITEQLTSTQLSAADILTTVGVSNTVDQITKPGTPYTKKVINIPKKSILVSENIAITASTEPSADVAIAMTNDEIIATIDQVPKQSSVDNVIANNDKSSVPIPIHLVAENITEYLNSTQLSPADILTAVGVSSADSSTIDQIIKLETQYNEEVINIPEKSRLAIENIDIAASTEPSADVTIAMSNDNVVPPTDRVPSLLTMHSNIIDKDKDKSLVPIPIHLVPENRNEYLTSTQTSPTNALASVGVSHTQPGQNQIINLETSYNENVNSIPEKSTLATEIVGITASPQPSADVAIAITNDNVVPTTDQVPLLLAVDSILIDNDKNKSAAPIPIHLVPENITEELTSTQLSAADILTTVGVSNTVDQITKPGTPYTKKVINIPKKSILVSENIAITASTEPSADVAIAMTNDEIIATIDQVPKQSSVDNVIANNDKSSVPIPIHLVAENITEYLNSTQLSPADILTAVGVSSADSSTIDQIIKLETQYNEEVINIPEKSRLAIENIDITASTEPSADVTIAMTNDNVVPTTDQVPLLLTVHSNLGHNEKNNSSISIGSASIEAPTVKVNTSTVVNIQINTNNTDNAILNTFSDTKLAEQNFSGIMITQNNLVAENNTPDLISKIKLTELSRSVPNSLSVTGSTDKVVATIDQDNEPLNIKTIMEVYNGTKNTAALTENTITINHTVVNLGSGNRQRVFTNMFPGNIPVKTDKSAILHQFTLPVTAHLEKVSNINERSEKNNFPNNANVALPDMYNGIIINTGKSVNSVDGQNINGENYKTSDLIQDNKNSVKVDLNVDFIKSFIDNAPPPNNNANNNIMITQSISNEPRHKDASNGGPIATERTSTKVPDNTLIKKISKFNCVTSDINNLSATEVSTDKRFDESGKVTSVTAPSVTSKDNIQSTINSKENNIPQSLQITATSSPMVLVTSTNYNTTSIPSTVQSGDTVGIADLVNNKPTETQDIKTAVKSPISDITTAEVKTKVISIGSNNSGGILDIHSIQFPHETSSISTATKTYEDLPSLSRNETAVSIGSVQKIVTKHTAKDGFLDSEKITSSDSKTTVSVKQLNNLDSGNFKSVSNPDMLTSTGQKVASQITVQSNSASATNTPVTENLSSNNLGNHQIENTFSNIYDTSPDYSQTTLTKTSSSNYYLGAVNSPENINPKISTDTVKTTYSSLTNIPQRVHIQKASTPDYFMKSTTQNLVSSKQLNAPGTVTVTVKRLSSPIVQTLTKDSIQNMMDPIIADQKIISVKQNDDKIIPTANPTVSTVNSNTDKRIKIVSTYNTVNSLNTMPSATLQLSGIHPSLSKDYVNTFQIQNPRDYDLNKLKSSITEYINNIAKTVDGVPAVENKQSTQNILSTSGLNSKNNRNVTYTTTLFSNSFDPLKPNVNYVTKKIVNDIGLKGVVTMSSENIPIILKNEPLNAFTSGSTQPAGSLSTVTVYDQSTVIKPLITESSVLSTKVNNIPTTVLGSEKSLLSTPTPFVTTGSDPTQRIVTNSNTQMVQSPLLVKLMKNINSPQDVISSVKNDQSVIADSNTQYFMKSPEPDSMVETIIFTKERINEPFIISGISNGFRRSYDGSNITSVQNNVDSEKNDTGSVPNNNNTDTKGSPIKLFDIDGADTVQYSESDGLSNDNVGSDKIEGNETSEKKSTSKDSIVKADAIRNKFLPPSFVTSQTNIDNNPIDLKLRREIGTKYSAGAIESVASEGNSQTEALQLNENEHNSSYNNITPDFQKYSVQLNLENQTDNVTIVKRNSTINDDLVDLTATNHTVTAYVQTYLNKDEKQGNKTSDALRLNESSMQKANTANVQLNASNKGKSTSTDSPPVFNCTARGRYADKNDCRKFYTCIGNHHQIMGTCPNNTVFSEIKKQCTRNLSHCVRNNQFRCLLEGRFSDFFKDNIYYICVRNCSNHFTRYKLQCQDGYHLDKESVRCERDEMTSTQSASSVSEVSNDETTTPKTKSEKIKSSSDDFECEKEGNFPYAKDCRKYYVCTKVKDVYRRKIKKCSKDEVYDKKKKKCVDSDSREC